MATSRLSQFGIGATPYTGFTAKDGASVGHPFVKGTRLTQIGIGGRRASFYAKDPAAGASSHPFVKGTRLTQICIGGRRVSFSAKTEADDLLIQYVIKYRRRRR